MCVCVCVCVCVFSSLLIVYKNILIKAYKYDVLRSYKHNKQYFIRKVKLVCVFIFISDEDLILCEYKTHKTINCNALNAFKGDFKANSTGLMDWFLNINT